MSTITPSETIGRPILIEGLVLPGTTLEPKADPDRTAPIAVRIVSVAPHGKLLRYDLEVTAWEPGPHDVRAYLQRADGTNTDDLPEIPVEAVTKLAPGMPHVSTASPVVPRGLGGYRERMIVGSALWFAGLIAIVVFLRRRKNQSHGHAAEAMTTADHLERLIGRARAGTLDHGEQAEIERLVYDAWQQALGITDTSPNEVVARLRQDDRAASALDLLAAWLHAPAGERPSDIATFVASLLPPRPSPAPTAPGHGASP